MKKLLVLALLAACGGGGKAAPPPQDPGSPGPADPEKDPAPEPEAPRATGNPKADLIPRSVLFGNPERAAVRISPDGKHLSWLAPKDGVLNVWVAPAGKLDEAKAVTSETKRPIRIYFWAYTSKHLLYMQDAAGDENYHVFRVDLEGGKTNDLTPFKGARATVAGMSDRQPTTLMVQINDRKPEAMDLHKIDLLTGKRELVVQNDDNLLDFTLDHKLRVRFATKKLPDGATQVLAFDGKAWQGELGIDRDDCLPGLTKLAARIRAGGAASMVQLFHGGVRADPKLTGEPTWSASTWTEDAPTFVAPRPAAQEDIMRVIRQFADAAARA